MEEMEEIGQDSILSVERVPPMWDEEEAELMPAIHTIALVHRGTAAQVHMIRAMLSTLFNI
jgi:hypothetical protein